MRKIVHHRSETVANGIGQEMGARLTLTTDPTPTPDPLPLPSTPTPTLTPTLTCTLPSNLNGIEQTTGASHTRGNS